LHNLILISRKKIDQVFWKNRNRRTHRRESKKHCARKSRDGQLCIEFHGILPCLPSFTRRCFPPRAELFVWAASFLVVCAPDTTLFCRTSQFTKRNDCDEA